MIHSFDVNVAKKYGVQEAILFNHLYFWIEKTKLIINIIMMVIIGRIVAKKRL